MVPGFAGLDGDTYYDDKNAPYPKQIIRQGKTENIKKRPVKEEDPQGKKKDAYFFVYHIKNVS